MLNRRTLLQAVAASATGAALPVLSQAPVTLKFSTFMAPTSNVWTIMLKPWMEKVEKDSGGRIKFEGYPAMQLGGTPPQLYDHAREGVADIVWTLPGYTAGRFPCSEVFELPFFMVGEAESTSRAYWEYIQTMAPDEFKGTKVLALHVHGRGAFHSRDRAIHKPSDLKGLKVRGPSRQVTKLLQSLGATPVGMPLPAIPDGLSKGTINALATAWDVVPSVKVHELTKHHSHFASNMPALYTATFVFAMNQAKYDALAPELKKVIDNNSGIDTSALFGKITQDSDAIGIKAATDRGNTIHTISGKEAEEFVKLSSHIDEEWIADMTKLGFDGKKLHSTAKTLMAKYAKS